MRIKSTIMAVCALAIIACEKPPETQAPVEVKTPPAAREVQKTASNFPAPSTLDSILEAQSEEVKARYAFRRPSQTLSFFGIEPGMTVVEALPGGGWYTKLLLPLLGEQGMLVGSDYPLDLWPKFGFLSEEQLQEKQTWSSDWPKQAEGWGIANSAKIAAFNFGAMPSDMAASADAVLFIRALHNLARFNDDGGFLDASLADAYKVLKPGGIVGVVQHEARENMPDEWAKGNNGYLKKAYVIEKMQAAGFELVAQSSINENPQDMPSETDIVWRLSPSLSTSKEDPELRAAIEKIGESHRMTLKFQKPE
ncbi:MAG: methyltransferase [Cellvibrionaceae bacterium]|nr:methyltransferase [Cellvibrionaceae bacterium]